MYASCNMTTLAERLVSCYHELYSFLRTIFGHTILLQGQMIDGNSFDHGDLRQETQILFVGGPRYVDQLLASEPSQIAAPSRLSDWVSHCRVTRCTDRIPCKRGGVD